jgi:hypothetical protein
MGDARHDGKRQRVDHAPHCFMGDIAMMIFDWYRAAMPGDSVEYGRGRLATARWELLVARLKDIPPKPSVAAFCADGEDAWRLYEDSKVTLVQRRYGKDDYGYIAIKRRQDA